MPPEPFNDQPQNQVPTEQPQPGIGSAGPTDVLDEPQPVSPLEQELESTAGSFFNTLGSIFSWVVLPLALIALLHFYVFQAYRVVGSSMQPTLQDNEYLIISKIDASKSSVQNLLGQKNGGYIPERGQIIVFHFPKEPEKTFVKRVVGIPGDRVVVRNGTVTVYNKANPSGFNPDVAYEEEGTLTAHETDETVEPGNVFVMGDNRTQGGSYDSREWGELPSRYIIGNAVLRLLPLDKAKVL